MRLTPGGSFELVPGRFLWAAGWLIPLWPTLAYRTDRTGD